MCATVIHVLYPPKITASSVPHLIKGLESPEPVSRESVCEAIAKLGRPAAPAIPAVIRLLKDPYNPQTDGYHWHAAWTLGRIAPGSPQAAEAVAALVEFLQSDPESWATKWTIEALGEFGPKAGAAVPRISELQQHKDEVVRKAATEALAKIQPAK
jgi:HEAT repeat protein